MVKRYIFFPKDWLNLLIKGTANRTGASGYMIAKKKKIIKKNVLANKNWTYVKTKEYRFSFFLVFQTKVKSDFINVVNTSEILFSQNLFSKIQVRFIHKRGLYIPFYDIN